MWFWRRSSICPLIIRCRSDYIRCIGLVWWRCRWIWVVLEQLVQVAMGKDISRLCGRVLYNRCTGGGPLFLFYEKEDCCSWSLWWFNIAFLEGFTCIFPHDLLFCAWSWVNTAARGHVSQEWSNCAVVRMMSPLALALLNTSLNCLYFLGMLTCTCIPGPGDLKFVKMEPRNSKCDKVFGHVRNQKWN